MIKASTSCSGNPQVRSVTRNRKVQEVFFKEAVTKEQLLGSHMGEQNVPGSGTAYAKGLR